VECVSTHTRTPPTDLRPHPPTHKNLEVRRIIKNAVKYCDEISVNKPLKQRPDLMPVGGSMREFMDSAVREFWQGNTISLLACKRKICQNKKIANQKFAIENGIVFQHAKSLKRNLAQTFLFAFLGELVTREIIAWTNNKNGRR